MQIKLKSTGKHDTLERRSRVICPNVDGLLRDIEDGESDAYKELFEDAIRKNAVRKVILPVKKDEKFILTREKRQMMLKKYKRLQTKKLWLESLKIYNQIDGPRTISMCLIDIEDCSKIIMELVKLKFNFESIMNDYSTISENLQRYLMMINNSFYEIFRVLKFTWIRLEEAEKALEYSQYHLEHKKESKF